MLIYNLSKENFFYFPLAEANGNSTQLNKSDIFMIIGNKKFHYDQF